MIIYIDQYIFTGFCMNMLLIHITDLIIRQRLSKLKKLLFSLTITLCSLTIFAPYINSRLHTIINIFATFLMLIVSFRPNKLVSAIRIIVVYCSITFATAGCAYMLMEFNLFNCAITVLLPTVLITYLIISFISDLYEKYYKDDKLQHQLTIYTKESSVELTGYFDTGNNLKDPVTKLPVIIVDAESVKGILPSDFVYKIELNENICKILSDYTDKLMIKLIPFHSIGGDGLLLGFVPEKITIDNIVVNGIIAISTNKVFTGKKGTAILHPQLII